VLPWHRGRPSADACRTKGSVGLRAIAAVPALMVRTRTGSVVGRVSVVPFGTKEECVIVRAALSSR